MPHSNLELVGDTKTDSMPRKENSAFVDNVLKLMHEERQSGRTNVVRPPLSELLDCSENPYSKGCETSTGIAGLRDRPKDNEQKDHCKMPKHESLKQYWNWKE